MSYHPPESIVSILATIRSTKRPRLLLRAARIGTQDYNRETDLRRVLRLPATPPPGTATVRALIDLEARLEAARKRPFQPVGEEALESWRPARHVEVMIALIAEARLMAEAVTPRPDRATGGLVPVFQTVTGRDRALSCNGGALG